MSKAKPSPSIALSLVAIIAVALMFSGYENCGRYHPNPYVSPCEDSLAYNLFPNSVAYLTGHGAPALMIGANVLFMAALWNLPWFRTRSWKRTILSLVGYLIFSAVFSFAVMLFTLG